MTTMINKIELGCETIEIHHNQVLTKRPYLVRIFKYTNYDPAELRLNEEEIKDLYNILKEQNLI
jgi:hypothetical protein